MRTAAGCVGLLAIGVGASSGATGVVAKLVGASVSSSAEAAASLADDSMNVVKTPGSQAVDKTVPGRAVAVKPRPTVASKPVSATVSLSAKAVGAGGMVSVRSVDAAVGKAAASRTANSASAVAAAAVGRGGATGSASPSSVTVATLDPSLFKGFDGGQGVAFAWSIHGGRV